MCTVSIIRTGEMIRIACNRDEQRTRLAALPPTLRLIDGIRAIMPTDANAGGTWIGVNAFGVAMMLLNMNPSNTCGSQHTITRGMIIPSLIHCATAQSACKSLKMQPLSQYKPFRLILVDADTTLECAFDGQTLTTQHHQRQQALMFTSSGLGDDMVDRPRRQQFERMMTDCSALEQDGFHRHSWTDQPHLSVCMRREDAMTVSCARIEISSETASMHYHAGPPDLSAETTTVTFAIRQLSIA